MTESRALPLRGRTGPCSVALLACLWLPACGIEVGDPVAGGGGGTGGGDQDVPEQVVAALERSCVPGCHDASSKLGRLSLERGALPGVLGANSTQDSAVPLVQFGDLGNSMLAIKVMEPETLALYGVDRPGSKMPLAPISDPDEILEDVAVIIAWIGGAKFPEGGGDTGGVEDWDADLEASGLLDPHDLRDQAW